jgi:hypothetical protein
MVLDRFSPKGCPSRVSPVDVPQRDSSGCSAKVAPNFGPGQEVLQIGPAGGVHQLVSEGGHPLGVQQGAFESWFPSGFPQWGSPSVSPRPSPSGRRPRLPQGVIPRESPGGRQGVVPEGCLASGSPTGFPIRVPPELYPREGPTGESHRGCPTGGPLGSPQGLPQGTVPKGPQDLCARCPSWGFPKCVPQSGVPQEGSPRVPLFIHYNGAESKPLYRQYSSA